MNAARDQAEIEADASQGPWFRALPSRGFRDWLQQQGVSLAFTTYQRIKLFFVGRKLDGPLAVIERTFPRCMGLWTVGGQENLGIEVFHFPAPIFLPPFSCPLRRPTSKRLQAVHLRNSP